MHKTITLPENLHTASEALTAHDPCELLFENRLVHFLTEEFESTSYSPDQSVVDRVLAYSKAVEVKKSETVVDDHVIMKN